MPKISTLYWLLLSPSLALLIDQTCAQCSVTVRGGPQENERCVFPFKFDGQTHRSCTTLTDPDEKPWCSTLVDEDGHHQGGQGNWGYCHPECKRRNDRVNFNPPGPRLDSNLLFDDPPLVNGPGPSAFPPPTTQLPLFRASPPPPTRSPPTVRGRVASTSGRWLPDPEKQECGQRSSVGFIRGGKEAIRGEFPFTALLGYTGFFEEPGRMIYLCGGTLINRLYVVTAAHCFDGPAPFAEIVLGEFDVTKDPDCPQCQLAQRFAVSREASATIHPGWNSADSFAGDDIALVRLPRLASTLTNDPDQSIVMPACLDWKRTQPPVDGDAYVVGWGQTEVDDLGQLLSIGSHSTTTQKLKVPLVSMRACENDYGETLGSKFICAGGAIGKDSCGGDSGGPLITRQSILDPSYLIGVVSFGTVPCGIGLPGVYTSIDYYMDWILSSMKP